MEMVPWPVNIEVIRLTIELYRKDSQLDAMVKELLGALGRNGQAVGQW